MALLGRPRYQAVGILESMWHYASQYAHRGDVCRHGEDRLARALGWEGGAADLVSALLRAGFLDRCRCHGIRIHDWPDHADQGVKRSSAVESSGFLECYSDPSSQLVDASSSLVPYSIGPATATATATVPATAAALVVGGVQGGRSKKPPKPADDIPEARQGCDDVAEILDRKPDHTASMLSAFARLVREGRTREQWRAVLVAYRDRSTQTAAFCRDGSGDGKKGGPGLDYLLRPGEKGAFDRVWLQLQEGCDEASGVRATARLLEQMR